MVSVQQLRISPVKGLASVLRREVHLDADGVAEDRRVLLLHADGTVVTMRKLPQLVRIVPELDLGDGTDLGAGTLSLTFPDGTRATTALGAATEPACSRLYGRDRSGRILPGEVAEAVSAFAGEPLRVLVADRTGEGWDEGPVSLISRASATAVAAPDDDADLARFRMLIEVDGAEAFEEDRWVGRRLMIGGAVVQMAEPLQRCVVIERDPRTGAKDWSGLKALAATRGSDRLTLGVFGVVRSPGRVRIGDEVLVD